jgi:flagellar protein FliT
MDNQEILSLYENVADIMQQMVEAARNSDWDQLTTLETRCTEQVAIIRQKDLPRQPLSTHAREHKTRIIKRILADDRQIRDITEPWMVQLSALMNNAGTERKLARAYGNASEY